MSSAAPRATTLRTPPAAEPVPATSSAQRVSATHPTPEHQEQDRSRRRPSTAVLIVLGSLALAALSLLAPTAPTYDPWAWIVWGREIADLDLDTVDGPSWKPLPVLFTAGFSVFGEFAPELWVWIARAGAIAALPLAFLLGRRLAGTPAGLFAAAGLLGAPWLAFNAALGNSEGILVALVLAGLLAAVERRHGWAFAFGVGAALLRPEAWPFLGLYGLWLLWRDRSRLVWVVGAGVGTVALWLGPELWGSGNAFRAGERAQKPNPGSPAFAEHPALEVLGDAAAMVPVLALAGAVVAVALLGVRRTRIDRDRVRAITAVGVLAVAWLGLVAAMTSGGFSGNQRYLIVPAALLVVVGAVGLALALDLVARRAHRATWAVPVAVAVVAVALGLSAPFAMRDDLREVDFQVALIEDLEALPLARCGPLVTGPRTVPAVAWRYGEHASDVGLEPAGRATVLHSKVQPWLPLQPALQPGAPGEVARRGAWVLRCAR